MAHPIRSPARQEWTMRECQGREPQESWSTSSQSTVYRGRSLPVGCVRPKPSRPARGLTGCARSAVTIISNVKPAQQCPEDRRLAHRMPRPVAVPALLSFSCRGCLALSGWPLARSGPGLYQFRTASLAPTPKPPNARSLPGPPCNKKDRLCTDGTYLLCLGLPGRPSRYRSWEFEARDPFPPSGHVFCSPTHPPRGSCRRRLTSPLPPIRTHLPTILPASQPASQPATTSESPSKLEDQQT